MAITFNMWRFIIGMNNEQWTTNSGQLKILKVNILFHMRNGETEGHSPENNWNCVWNSFPFCINPVDKKWIKNVLRSQLRRKLIAKGFNLKRFLIVFSKNVIWLDPHEIPLLVMFFCILLFKLLRPYGFISFVWLGMVCYAIAFPFATLSFSFSFSSYSIEEGKNGKSYFTLKLRRSYHYYYKRRKMQHWKLRIENLPTANSQQFAFTHSFLSVFVCSFYLLLLLCRSLKNLIVLFCLYLSTSWLYTLYIQHCTLYALFPHTHFNT